MKHHLSPKALPAARRMADKAFQALEHFFHIEAVSGIVLMLAAAVALIWANSPAADSYHHLWHMPLSISLGDWVVSQSLHFWINDGLMTIFFLVVGLEIRREMHEGALASVQLAALPMIAALGGVTVPALLYLAFNHSPELHSGWAVPTATDIAFAMGVLALLGKSIPSSVRVFLLALAIIDDIAAVLIIALFYSNGLDPMGLLIAAGGVLLVLGFQQIGIGSAYAYVLPGALLWFGLLKSGAHPTLAGVILGLMTPVFSRPSADSPLELARVAVNDVIARVNGDAADPQALVRPVRQLRGAQRELLPPVVRVQTALHPWVAYGIMPLFALANAGVSLDGVNLHEASSLSVMLGVLVALVVGKPIGVMLSTWLMVRLGWGKLPDEMNWSWVALIGVLAGIGFTMSIFIAGLAFTDAGLLSAAKLGVLLASATAATLGLVVGALVVKRARKAQSVA